MRLVIISVAALFFAASCNTPSLPFYGADVTRISVEGSAFDIRRKGNFAEAIRVSPTGLYRFEPIARRAEVAIGLVTGCRVREVRGDVAVIVGALDCTRVPATPARIARPASEPECEVVDEWTPSGAVTTWYETEC